VLNSDAALPTRTVMPVDAVDARDAVDAVDAIAAAQARTRRVADFIPDGLVLTTPAGSVTWVSPAFERMTGLDANAAVGVSLVLAFHPDDRLLVERCIAAVRTGRDGVFSSRLRDPLGAWRWCDVTVVLAHDDAPGVPDELAVRVRDVHERHQRRTRRPARHDVDSLTGVLNRAGLDRAIADLAANGTEIVAAFCDVDDVRKVNDAHGHHVGDELLRATAETLKAAVRAGDVVARIGADEFVVIAVVDESIDAGRLGQRLVEAVRRATEAHCSISVGACGPGPASEASALLRDADDAMYDAKRGGKDSWVGRAWQPTAG
jgi:diguanylate cyclase (GGDEF)-like protein/PAS domain S-box-containing protein